MAEKQWVRELLEENGLYPVEDNQLGEAAVASAAHVVSPSTAASARAAVAPQLGGAPTWLDSSAFWCCLEDASKAIVS